MMARKVGSLGDIKGKRVRTFSTPLAELVKALEGAPQQVPASELYQALQKGIVDGAIRSSSDSWNFGEQDVYKTQINPPAIVSGGQIFVTTRAWDKWPKDVQDLLASVAKEMEPKVFRVFPSAECGVTEKLKKNGLTVYELTPAEREQMIRARQAYWGQVSEKNPGIRPKAETDTL